MSDSEVRERLLEKIYKFNTEDVVAMLLKNHLDHCCKDIVSERIDGEKLLLKTNWWTNELEPSVRRDLCEFVEHLIRNPSDYLSDLRISDEEYSPSYEEDYSSDNEFWGSDFEDEVPRAMISVEESYSSNEKESVSDSEIYSNGESWTKHKDEISPKREAEIEPEENMYANKSEVGDLPGKLNDLSLVEKLKAELARRNFSEKPKIGPKPTSQMSIRRYAEPFAASKPKDDSSVITKERNSQSKFPPNLRTAINSQLHKKLPTPVVVNGFGKKTTPKNTPLGSVEDFTRMKAAQENVSRDIARTHDNGSRDVAQTHARKPIQKPPVPPPPDNKFAAKPAIILPKPPANTKICASPLPPSRSVDESDDETVYEPIDERLSGANLGQFNNGSMQSLGNGSIHKGSHESVHCQGTTEEGNYEVPNEHVPEKLPVPPPFKKPIPEIKTSPYSKPPLPNPIDDGGYVPPFPNNPQVKSSTLPRPLPATPSPTNSLKRLPPGSSSTYPKPNSELSNRPLPSPPFTENLWFHNVRRDQAEALVRGGSRIGPRGFAAAAELSTSYSSVEGCFLVRPSSAHAEQPFTLVLWAIGRPYNIAIRKRPDGQYALGEVKLGEVCFPSIDALVEYYQKNDLVLKSKGVQTGTTRLTKTPQKKNDWTV